jgi:hypothetical protein
MIVGLREQWGIECHAEDGVIVEDEWHVNPFLYLPADKPRRTVTRVGLLLQTLDSQLYYELLRSVKVRFRCELTGYNFASLEAAVLTDPALGIDNTVHEGEQFYFSLCRSVAVDEYEFKARDSFEVSLDAPRKSIKDTLNRACEQDAGWRFVCVIRPFVVLREGRSELAALFAAVSAYGCNGCTHSWEGSCQRDGGPHYACVAEAGARKGPYR